MASNIHNIHFDVEIDSDKGIVTSLKSTFNGEETVLIPDGSRKTVSVASEAIRQTIMEHKKDR